MTTRRGLGFPSASRSRVAGLDCAGLRGRFWPIAAAWSDALRLRPPAAATGAAAAGAWGASALVAESGGLAPVSASLASSAVVVVETARLPRAGSATALDRAAATRLISASSSRSAASSSAVLLRRGARGFAGVLGSRDREAVLWGAPPRPFLAGAGGAGALSSSSSSSRSSPSLVWRACGSTCVASSSKSSKSSAVVGRAGMLVDGRVRMHV